MRFPERAVGGEELFGGRGKRRRTVSGCPCGCRGLPMSARQGQGLLPPCAAFLVSCSLFVLCALSARIVSGGLQSDLSVLLALTVQCTIRSLVSLEGFFSSSVFVLF